MSSSTKSPAAVSRRPRKASQETVAGAPRDAAAVGPFVGAALKKQRQLQHLTIQDVASLAEISRGMISRIENGQAMPSLDTLARICQAVGLTMAHLFKDFDLPDGVACHVPAGRGMVVVRRGTRRGHSYELLAYDQGPKKLFEPFLITLDDQSEIFPRFQHAGVEFIYMLKGKMEYRHGQKVYSLKVGDSLSFEGSVPHGPERLLQMPIQFLAIIHYEATE